MAKMLGATTPVGFGGKTCACCKEAPGKGRVIERRTARRREQAAWRREVAVSY